MFYILMIERMVRTELWQFPSRFFPQSAIPFVKQEAVSFFLPSKLSPFFISTDRRTCKTPGGHGQLTQLDVLPEAVARFKDIARIYVFRAFHYFDGEIRGAH